MSQETITLATIIALSALTFFCMKMQRLISVAPALALLYAMCSNYLIVPLSQSRVIEIAIRITVAYAVIRGSAELTKRTTTGNPPQMRYASQMQNIEFEEVETP